MKETIYLVVSRQRVERMLKSLPQTGRGEIPVKVIVEVDAAAFREPVIERAIHITDWRGGIDIADVDLREATITEAEAEQIRTQRLAAMRKILEAHGHTVTRPQDVPEGSHPPGGQQ